MSVQGHGLGNGIARIAECVIGIGLAERILGPHDEGRVVLIRRGQFADVGNRVCDDAAGRHLDRVVGRPKAAGVKGHGAGSQSGPEENGTVGRAVVAQLDIFRRPAVQIHRGACGKGMFRILRNQMHLAGVQSAGNVGHVLQEGSHRLSVVAVKEMDVVHSKVRTANHNALHIGSLAANGEMDEHSGLHNGGNGAAGDDAHRQESRQQDKDQQQG